MQLKVLATGAVSRETWNTIRYFKCNKIFSKKICDSKLAERQHLQQSYGKLLVLAINHINAVEITRSLEGIHTKGLLRAQTNLKVTTMKGKDAFASSRTWRYVKHFWRFSLTRVTRFIFFIFFPLKTINVVGVHKRLTIGYCADFSPILELGLSYWTIAKVLTQICFPFSTVETDTHCATNELRRYLRRHGPLDTSKNPFCLHTATFWNVWHKNQATVFI